MEIRIKNFQSLKDVKLSIGTGLTLITGRTNAGKSAIFRAINAAIFNTGDDSMIRGGCDKSEVVLANDEHTLTFTRNRVKTAEKTEYIFDGGEPVTKVGRNELPEVIKNFNIFEVKMANNVKVRLNFWDQGDKPFLMDKTPGQLYEFMSLSSADKYTKILKKMKKDAKSLDVEITTVSAEIDTLKNINLRKQQTIDSNKGFDELYERLVKVSNREKEVRAIEELSKETESVAKTISEKESTLKALTEECQNIDIETVKHSIENLVKEESDTTILDTLIETTAKEGDKISALQASENALVKKSGAVSELINETRGGVETFSERFAALSAEALLLSKMQNDIASAKGLQEKINEIDKVYKDTLPDVPNLVARLADADNLMSLCEVITKDNTSIEKLAGMLNTIDSEITGNEKELDSLKKVAGYCPYCGTVFNRIKPILEE